MATWQRNDAPGFTLVEVLVAMTIVAVSLLAALRVATQGVSHADELRGRLLAGWVAADRLAEHRARGDWLPVELGWREEVSATPNAAFHRVDVFVFVPAQPAHFLAHSTGFVVDPSESGR